MRRAALRPGHCGSTRRSDAGCRCVLRLPGSRADGRPDKLRTAGCGPLPRRRPGAITSISRQQCIAALGIKNDRELLDTITSTAELAWGLLLTCCRRFPEAFDAVRRGVWARDAVRGHQLSGKTLGILGCGRLGTMMAQYGQAFRMKILGCDTQSIDMPGVDDERVDFDRL